MPTRDRIVIGASAGSIDALRSLTQALPSRLNAAVLVVVHLPSHGRSQLARILDTGALRAHTATDGMPLEGGRIYVAPPNRHMVIEGERLRLDPGPRENGFRPSIDRLFRSAATAAGPRVIGVVLSGMRDNGAEGLALIKRLGGVAIVQDPEEALFRSMPESALREAVVDHVAPVRDIVRILVERSAERVTAMKQATVPVEEGADPDLVNHCPECGGVAREVTDGGVVRHVCRVGHAFSPESFLLRHGKHVEEALWAAVNALSERRAITRRMARRAQETGHDQLARRYEELADEAHKRAESIRAVLFPFVEEQLPEDTGT